MKEEKEKTLNLPHDYQYDDAYIVSDYRLTDFASQDIGVSLEYKPGYFDDKLGIAITYDMFQTDQNAYIENWYGETQVKAEYGTIAISYDF